MSGVTNDSPPPAPTAGWVIRPHLPDVPLCVLPRSAPGNWLIMWVLAVTVLPVVALLTHHIGDLAGRHAVGAAALAVDWGVWAVIAGVFCITDWVCNDRRMAVSGDWLAWRPMWSRRWRILPFSEVTATRPARSRYGVAVRLTNSCGRRVKVRFHELRGGGAAGLLDALGGRQVLTDETKAILSGVGGPASLVPSSPALIRNLDGHRRHDRPRHTRPRHQGNGRQSGNQHR